jgi:N-acetylglucosamine kinase-like BadF-type ATPase
MSLLIADIGASSSRWALLDEAGGTVCSNLNGPRIPGFNAAGADPAPLLDALHAWANEVPALLAADLVQVYGAGCGAPERAARMRDVLATRWPAAAIEVGTDLLGAARSVYGEGPGLVLILGTGMNAGFHDGVRPITTIPSLGYIIGDEGSGADIGKQLFRDLYQGRMPEEIQQAVFGGDVPDLQEVVAQVYRGTAPARFLAAPVVHLVPHIEHPYVHGLITTRFRKLCALLTGWFPEGQRQRVAAVGSVANGFHDLLGPCLAEQGMVLTEVMAEPLEGLVRYHGARPA